MCDELRYIVGSSRAVRGASGDECGGWRLIAALCSVQAALATATPSPAIADAGGATGAAEDTPLACRPTIARTADLVAPGHFEVETGYAGRKSRSGIQHSTPTLLKLTVTDVLQVQLATDGFVAERGKALYLAPPLLAAKVRFLEQSDAVPAFAVSAGIGMPVHPHHRVDEYRTRTQPRRGAPPRSTSLRTKPKPAGREAARAPASWVIRCARGIGGRLRVRLDATREHAAQSPMRAPGLV